MHLTFISFEPSAGGVPPVAAGRKAERLILVTPAAWGPWNVPLSAAASALVSFAVNSLPLPLTCILNQIKCGIYFSEYNLAGVDVGMGSAVCSSARAGGTMARYDGAAGQQRSGGGREFMT